MLLHVILLRYHCKLSPRLNHAYKMLLKSKRISLRIIKKFCNLLACKNLINPDWLMKPVENLVANAVDLGLLISAKINGQTVYCVLNTGSTFSLVPQKILNL